MKSFRLYPVLPIALDAMVVFAPHSARAARTSIGHLRCEYADNPIGIGETRPRLSWQIASDQRGARQTAYEILVASSEETLKRDRGDLWDSGKIASDRAAQIVYGGSPLHSAERCYWKVRVWYQSGDDAGWSRTASFETGLLSPTDWKALWIGVPNESDTGDPFAGAHWIWTNEEGADRRAEPGTRIFKREFTLPEGANIVAATMTLTADDQFTLTVNNKTAAASGTKYESWKRPVQVDLTKALQPGVNTLDVSVTNTTKSAAGLLASLTIRFADGRPPMTLFSDKGWSYPQTANGAAGSLPAHEVAAYGESPWGKLRLAADGNDAGPGRYLRHAFQLRNKPVSARLYATALGVYEPYLNGKRVGDDVFAPGWTDYHKRVACQTYDVTDLLRSGANAMGLIVGDGWYAGHIGLVGRGVYGTSPFASCELHVTYADGGTETIVTDNRWRGTTLGPIVASDLQSGETYDARREFDGWSAPGFDEGGWSAVQTDDKVTAVREAQIGPPVRREQELTPHAISQPAPGHYVFDLGQNMVGWARLKARGSAGSKITLRFAEMLNPNGTIYTANYRGARCIDEYTLRGDGKGETYDPHFTFRGFRYVEITGWPGKDAPDKDAITGIVVHSDTPRTGTMETSSPLVNKLLQNIDWGQRGNFLSVPTDCPQRDERLGWMGDAQIFVRTATCNRDVASFFTKWMVDVDDAQTADGAFTDVSPHVAAGAGTAAWGDAGVICPWTIYLAYGDTRILEHSYPSMQRWIDYCTTHSTDLIRPAAGYGDWLSIQADTPKDVLATAYFAYSTHLTANAARVLGKSDDAAKYEALFAQIKTAFDAAFVAPDGQIKGATQTDYVLSLRFDLLPDNLRPSAAHYLAADIAAKQNHLSTGFVGVGYLCPTLTATGHTDVAYTLLNQDTFPSWGYAVRHGATTIWERWDGWTADKGFQNPGMNSFNHYSLGSVGEWLYSDVAGIGLDPAQPGCKHIVIHPHPGGGLTYAGADYDALPGKIGSHWKIDGDQFRLDVTIPANTTAAVYVPAASADVVTESGKAAGAADGVTYLRSEPGFVEYAVQSGSYHFAAPSVDVKIAEAKGL